MNKDIEQKQVEKLTEIGAYLRQVREESELSLEQVATKTLIQARLIRAIENGKLYQLPEPVYIQGFIKRYADVLGLNGTAVASAFPTELDIRAIQPSWKDSPAAQLRPLHLYVAYVVLMVTAVSLLSYVVGRSAPWASTETPIEQTTDEPLSNQPKGVANSSASAAPRTSASSVSNSDAVDGKPVRVDVQLTSQSWLRIVIDGKTEFEGVLPEGTQRTWMAESQLTIRAGNAGGVLLAYNDGQAERMGDPGAVEEVTFPLSQSAASLPNVGLETLPR